MCKLRLEMSDLNNDLFKRHLTDDPACDCGYDIEDAAHFLVHCPLHQHARVLTIGQLAIEVQSNTSTLLFGNNRKTTNENMEILLKVGNFVNLSEGFKQPHD